MLEDHRNASFDLTDLPSDDGIKFLNNSITSQPTRTVVVFGVGRGGTSAVAGLCRILGVAMPDPHPLKHESSPLVYVQAGLDRSATWQNIRAMDERHDIWGWKSPKDVFVESAFLSMLRNPHVIVVLRNPLDVIDATMRADNVDYISSVRHVAKVYEELFQFTWSSDVPLALINFECFRARPGPVIKRLARWLGITASNEQLQRAETFVTAKRGEYRSIETDENGRAVIDAAEIDIDQTNAQIALYAEEIQVLAGRISDLRADIDVAQAIRAELLSELTQMDTSAELPTFFIGNGVINAALAIPPPPPELPDYTALRPEHAQKLNLVYYQWRAYYLHVLECRRVVQFDMDALAMKLGRNI